MCAVRASDIMSSHIFDHYSQDDCDEATEGSYENCPHPGCFIEEVRYADGSLKIRNLHMSRGRDDFLYHLGFGTKKNLVELFSDVKVSSNISKIIRQAHS